MAFYVPMSAFIAANMTIIAVEWRRMRTANGMAAVSLAARRRPHRG